MSFASAKTRCRENSFEELAKCSEPPDFVVISYLKISNWSYDVPMNLTYRDFLFENL